MATLKTVTLAAALIAGATSPAIAQNGPPTGGEPPIAGGEQPDRRRRRPWHGAG